MTSSPLRVGATLEQELDYYKKQYEQLESDLADFQASSKELEEQLEKDVDVAEKNERKLKEQVEKLGFEVDEWKGKHKQSKIEANNAHNSLQKEITGMRESNRGLQMRLRDIEVSNDDYERQARNTTSSLEDLENKLNQSIERGVMLDEELKIGEQERESLRIECQRLRDEHGDLKVENEITVEKLRLAEETIEKLRAVGRKPGSMAVENLRGRSPVGSDASGVTPSSPTASTPPTKSESSALSETQTPPSPPLSDVAANGKLPPRTPLAAKRKSLVPDASATPRAGPLGPRAPPNHSRAPSVNSTRGQSDAKSMKPPTSKPSRPASRPSIHPVDSLPRSDSLYQIRGLIGRMQKIEERVHSARSKLPPPKDGTPRSSPHATSSLGNNIPASVTLRRSSKRPSATPSAVSSLVNGDDEPSSDRLAPTSSRRDSHIERLSYGLPRPTSSASERPSSALGVDRPSSRAAGSRMSERPPSALGQGRPSSRGGASRLSERPPSALSQERPSLRAEGGHRSERPASARDAGRPPSRVAGNHVNERPPSAAGTDRPSSRAATSRPSSRASFVSSSRPSSRLNSAQTGYSGASNGSKATSTPRPSSSLGGNYATISGPPRSSLHRPSASVSELRRVAAESEDSALFKSSAGRRTTLDKSGLPQPGASKRQSGGLANSRSSTSGRKSTQGNAEMGPPPSRRKMSDVGETY
ncbi:hypothetical protein MBLNU230_g6947t1 [Neophaeotheca triangularis]